MFMGVNALGNGVVRTLLPHIRSDDMCDNATRGNRSLAITMCPYALKYCVTTSKLFILNRMRKLNASFLLK